MLLQLKQKPKKVEEPLVVDPPIDAPEKLNPDYNILTPESIGLFSEIVTELTKKIAENPDKATHEERSTVVSSANDLARGVNSLLIERAEFLNDELVRKGATKTFGMSYEVGRPPEIKRIGDPIALSKGVDKTLPILDPKMYNSKKGKEAFINNATWIESVIDGSFMTLSAIAAACQRQGQKGLESTEILRDRIEHVEYIFDQLEFERQTEEPQTTERLQRVA